MPAQALQHGYLKDGLLIRSACDKQPLPPFQFTHLRTICKIQSVISLLNALQNISHDLITNVSVVFVPTISDLCVDHVKEGCLDILKISVLKQRYGPARNLGILPACAARAAGKA